MLATTAPILDQITPTAGDDEIVTIARVTFPKHKWVSPGER